MNEKIRAYLEGKPSQYLEAYNKIIKDMEERNKVFSKMWKVCTKCDAVISPEFSAVKCKCGGSLDYIEEVEW